MNHARQANALLNSFKCCNFFISCFDKIAEISNSYKQICWHLWRGVSKHSLNTSDAIQRWTIRLISDPALTDTLDSLAHRRSVAAISLFYRYYHGFCSDKIRSIIPPKALLRDFLRLNTPTRLNSIPIERTHSPIRLFL